MKELIEMTQILQGMSTDTYMQCKYALLLASMGHQETKIFLEKLFSLADGRRPLCIGMNCNDGRG